VVARADQERCRQWRQGLIKATRSHTAIGSSATEDPPQLELLRLGAVPAGQAPQLALPALATNPVPQGAHTAPAPLRLAVPAPHLVQLVPLKREP
jgi:hypothetical protein